MGIYLSKLTLGLGLVIETRGIPTILMTEVDIYLALFGKLPVIAVVIIKCHPILQIFSRFWTDMFFFGYLNLLIFALSKMYDVIMKP